MTDIDDLMSEAHATGLILPNGELVPLVPQTLLDGAAARSALQTRRATPDRLPASPDAPTSSDSVETARSLAQSGIRDERIARTLERAGADALERDPSLASVLFDEAEAAGTEALRLAAGRAQAAAATGNIDRAARLLDDRFAEADEESDAERALDTAAAIWAQRGMLARSVDVYRSAPAERRGASAAAAAIAAIGVGDTDAADINFSSIPDDAERSSSSIAMSMAAHGIRESLGSSTTRVMAQLIMAADVFSASESAAPVPETPAALAAIVALNSGEIDLVESITEDALRSGHGASVERPRLVLLRAWGAMQMDRPDRAWRLLDELTVAEQRLTPRDDFMHAAIEVGLARRADDGPALLRAWRRARERILHVSVDLYSLTPLEELMVAGARLRDADRLEASVTEAWALLRRLGNPPLWSARLHWSAVQAAILSDSPSELAPHAGELVRAAQHNHLASVLAAAGRTWLAVLAESFDTAAVEAAARGLASVGMTWEGSRLAGHAAARCEERKDMARLLASASELHPGALRDRDDTSTARGDASAHRAGPARSADLERDASGLSAREREIARLVLGGKTYREIAETIFISPRTAEHHIARIRQRFGVSSRAELLDRLRVALGAPD